jgi:protein-tyrosine phosphatase
MKLPKWDAITEELIVGSFPGNRDAIRHIRERSEVTAILSLQSDDDHSDYDIDWFDLQGYGEELGLVMKRVPMLDFDPADQRRVLGEAVHCLASLRRDGHLVYVHCTAGINRSPLVVLGYLTYCQGVSLEDASLLLVTNRLHAAPAIEVWRDVRLDLLGPRLSQLQALSQEIASTTGPVDDRRAEAERRVLRHIFLPSARQT